MDSFSVSMDLDSGCVVVLKNGRVQGKMSRDQSVLFAGRLIDWSAEKYPPETGQNENLVVPGSGNGQF
jgi:hypothetical protein